ncbi:hypothetical protein ACRARG_00055 [Pseudooceanicola sp. C21-150M6]|uniref:hypothetical protein n=1 Tax=Pseudooceanicola sp. C21-150M6 TaxID=3434355 RepID=UPI003D7F2E31
MKWQIISENWHAYTPAVLDRWPEAEEEDVLALDGSQTGLAMYLSQVTGAPATDVLAQIEDWRMGHIPSDVRMDPSRDNRNMDGSAALLGAGEEPMDRDDIFGDDSRSSVSAP